MADKFQLPAKIACQQLMQHYDTVQIFVSKYDHKNGNTYNASWGEGNHYSRVGQVQEWLIRRDEEARISVRPLPPPEDAEGWKS